MMEKGDTKIVIGNNFFNFNTVSDKVKHYLFY